MDARLAPAPGATKRLAERELGPRSLERPVALGVEAQRLREVTLGGRTGRKLSAAAGQKREHRRSCHVPDPALECRERGLRDVDAPGEQGRLDEVGCREERQPGVARSWGDKGQCLEAFERTLRSTKPEVE